MFRSYWMGGFECSTHRNHANDRLDMIAGTQHDIQAESDYALLRTVGMETARDGLRWHLIERERGVYDWSSFLPMLEASHRQGVQVIWDLCHYGWPDWLDFFSPEFPERFALFSEQAARVIRERSPDVPFYSPINEISFFAWAASRTLMFPHAEGRDDEMKRQIIRAVIASVQAILIVDSRARFIYPEPAIHVVPQPDRPETKAKARRYSESQYEAWDMIAGFQSPELGGKPEYLDILGVNFYPTNEWRVLDGARLIWDQKPPDPEWRPFHLLLNDIWERYRKPLFVAETSNVGQGRAAWILEIGSELMLAHRLGVPVEGVCLYPIIDRYDWANKDHWHNSGLWDFVRGADPRYPALGSSVWIRVLDQPYADALRTVQRSLSSLHASG